jgi:cysteine synthase A
MAAAGLDAIGNTPLVRLRSTEDEGGGELWAKWEGANPTGSMKDRMAIGMVTHGEASGVLRPGMRVVEYTGGSTGSSLAMVCAARGYRAHLVTADCFAAEKIQTMRAFGAVVEVLESDGGKVTPELFDRFKARIAELAEEPDTWWAQQFVNPGNAIGYRLLGSEIWEQSDGRVDGFVMGVGTGGCFSGVAEVLKNYDAAIRCVAVEPASSRNLSGGASRWASARRDRGRVCPSNGTA